MGSHPATRAYVQRRTAEGLSKKEIIRCLKRYVAARQAAALADPSRGWDAIVIGEYERAIFGVQYASRCSPGS
jgi:hypothetical protein